MKIRFLGTGTSQGIPMIACECRVCKSLDFRDKRLRTSVQIELEGKSFVIDSGADFRQQMLANQIKQLDAILFTHQHKDHTAGLDDVRAFNAKDQRDMPIYARQEVLDQLKKEFAYIFSENKYPGVPNVETHVIQNEAFYIDKIQVTPIEVMHYKLAIFGYRIQDFTYITDASFISEKELEKIYGTKVLVINALRKEPHLAHFNLAQALEMIEKIKPEKAFLIHLSHNMGLHQEVSKELPENVFFAYDGLRLEI
ncbi:MAG: MBL fold metallo-hydrolase [Bacteroidetes bacterium]|nr:MAG: MBL fold metallo-hydrolase [Bacteroidota bacterium]